jgi:hypothetical protein
MTNLPGFDSFRSTLVLLRDKLADDLVQMQKSLSASETGHFYMTRKRLMKTSELLRSMKSFREAFEE